ncbi:unnamed protein product [Discosporangium mesarthrocarpum]
MLGGRGGVPVTVRPAEEDFLNQFETKGETMRKLMQRVESGGSFREREEKIGGPLKRALNALAPAIFPLEPNGRFRWMMAADYFWCAEAHGLEILPELKALGPATIAHLVWRFSRFYGDRDLLRTMTGPMLSDILERARRCHGGDRIRDKQSRRRRGGPGAAAGMEGVVSFSCHDVTIMSLLYALRSDLVKQEDYWSPYGSTIVFELFKPKPSKEGLGSNGAEGTAPEGWAGNVMGSGGSAGGVQMVRVIVDGVELRSPLCRGGSDLGGMMSLEDMRSGFRELLE